MLFRGEAKRNDHFGCGVACCPRYSPKNCGAPPPPPGRGAFSKDFLNMFATEHLFPLLFSRKNATSRAPASGVLFLPNVGAIETHLRFRCKLGVGTSIK